MSIGTFELTLMKKYLSNQKLRQEEKKENFKDLPSVNKDREQKKKEPWNKGLCRRNRKNNMANRKNSFWLTAKESRGNRKINLNKLITNHAKQEMCKNRKNSYDTTIWRWTSITSKEDNGKDNKRSNPRIFLEIKKVQLN